MKKQRFPKQKTAFSESKRKTTKNEIIMVMKKTSKTKRLPKFTTADYLLREHPFIIKTEKMFRRMISNATKSGFRKTDLHKYVDTLVRSFNSEKREIKKYLKWYKKTITSVPTGLSSDDRKKAKEIAKRNEKLCNELMGWIDLMLQYELPPNGLD